MQTIRPDIETHEVPGYWERYKDSARWTTIASWIKFFSPMNLLVDVGCYDTRIILEGEAEERICVDLVKFPDNFAGIKIQEEWLKTKLPRYADLLLCSETVEHQPDDEVLAFTGKLLADTRLLIVSMPLHWPKGQCSRHFQDPIDKEKFDYLMHNRRPLKVVDDIHVQKNKSNRVTRIALYAGDAR